MPAAKFLTLKPYHEPISFPQTIHEIILRRQSEPICPWVFPARDCAQIGSGRCAAWLKGAAYVRVAAAQTNGRSRIHFVTAHFSPCVTGAPPCSDAASTWPRLLQYSK